MTRRSGFTNGLALIVVLAIGCGGGADKGTTDGRATENDGGATFADVSSEAMAEEDAAADGPTSEDGGGNDGGLTTDDGGDGGTSDAGPSDGGGEDSGNGDSGVADPFPQAFGVFAVFTEEFADFGRAMGFSDLAGYQDWAGGRMKELGATWTRSNLQFVWDLVEPEVGDPFDWMASRGGDEVFAGAARHGVHYLAVFHEGSGPKSVSDPQHPMLRNPLEDLTAYKRFVKAAVERYDGDGVDDNPYGIVIKHWQAGNETPGWTDSGRNAGDYVAWFSAIAEAAREADPEARMVVIASTDATRGDPLHEQVVPKLAAAGVRFDAIDLHHWGTAKDFTMSAVPEYRSALQDLGLPDVELWSCEHGTNVGTPVERPGQCSPACNQNQVCVPGLSQCRDRCASDASCPAFRPHCDTDTGLCNLAEQTQADQARSLVYRYVVNRALGVKRIMWNNLAAWHCFSGMCGGFFDLVGLVADGYGPGETAADVGRKRLSFHSYRMLAERTDAPVAEQLGEVSTGDPAVHVYSYRNFSTGKVGFVAWADSVGQATLDFSDAEAMVTGLITDADGVPLRSETIGPSGGKVAVDLDPDPVWIEERL
ncbi:MAG: hypothetical protein HY897_06560 [Deltaproteobacteria bacterium]|nr:hypothetical protein [Deltaproteobacteria bacterium]